MTACGPPSLATPNGVATQDAASGDEHPVVGARNRLNRLRASIDLVDDALVACFAARRCLVRRVASTKYTHGIAVSDPLREQAVRARAVSLARRVGVPASTALALVELAIADAHRIQSRMDDLDQGGQRGAGATIHSAMNPDFAPRAPTRWLRWLPPPARVAPLLRAVPPAVQREAIERALSAVLAHPVAVGALDFMRDRRLGIEIEDLGLAWTLEVQTDRVAVVDGPADASVRGTATDLLLLASRLEDADTLFFHRRLVLTGDTELGLHLRNVLDRMPWESVPIGLRIVLHRVARLARDARDAYRA